MMLEKPDDDGKHNKLDEYASGFLPPLAGGIAGLIAGSILGGLEGALVGGALGSFVGFLMVLIFAKES